MTLWRVVDLPISALLIAFQCYAWFLWGQGSGMSKVQLIPLNIGALRMLAVLGLASGFAWTSCSKRLWGQPALTVAVCTETLLISTTDIVSFNVALLQKYRGPSKNAWRGDPPKQGGGGGQTPSGPQALGP